MSTPRKNNHGLENLTDSLVEDILNASDQEILEEADEDYGSSMQIADNTRALFEKTRSAVAKRRLLSAREALNAKKHSGAKIIKLDPAEARRRLNKIWEHNPEAVTKLTLAARKGSELSDEDVLGMLEDLEELGLSSFLETENKKE